MTTRLPVSCPKYEPVPGSKRCVHYLPNGACARPDELMCVEWLKANGHEAAPPPPTPAPLERNLLGELVRREPPPARTKPRPAHVAASAPVTPTPIVHTLRDEDIASFKALGAEVCLASDDLGEVWLVPAYTGQDRLELSVEHAALLAAVGAVFPGARVTRFVRTTGHTVVASGD
ncbi:MAG: hypothetical protein IT379_10395 [Deltaproteobacteria bacterium]|nr:hypothetical protein [Deltaproteobacteria bacterium]